MLVSSDQYSFILPKEAALKAGMLADMLGEDSRSMSLIVSRLTVVGAFSESQSNICRLDIRHVS